MTISRPVVLLALIAFAIFWGVKEVRAVVEYSRYAGSYWDLSVKASTLQQKSDYLDQYVSAISDKSKFADNDAIVFPTPNNSYAQNLVALKSLQGRVHQIQGMDETSFAYQTAMQQITAQEQGEAQDLTNTFEGCWYLQNHTALWGWIDLLIWIGTIISILVMAVWLATDD